MAIQFPAEGRNYLLSTAVGNQTKIADWYIMLFEGDYTPKEDDKASNIAARATEITAYVSATRPLFDRSPVSGGSTNNSASMASVTLTAAKTVRGFALVSSAAKGSGTGVLLAIERLPAQRAYAAGDVIEIPVNLAVSNQ